MRYGFTSIMARKDLVDKGELKTVSDLKGRKFAIPGPGTGDSSTLDVALKAAGGSGFSDVNPVYMSFAQEAAAFANGAIDAGFASEPNVTIMERAGTAVRFIGVDKIYPNQQTAVLLYGGDFIKNRPEVAGRFMRAYLKALRDYNDALDQGRLAGPKGDAVIAILAKHMKVKDPAILHAMVPHAVARDGSPNVAGLDRDRQFFVDSGLAPASVTVHSVLDDSFRRAALADLQNSR
jgi:NitT/TauT family transport system substrate-binding protein